MTDEMKQMIIEYATLAGVFILILLVSWIVIGILMSAAGGALNKQEKVPDLLKKFILSMTKKVFWVIAIVIALGSVGVDVTAFIAGLGVAGFILGFAFQDTLSNLAAGVMLLIYQPFDVGHYVEAGGESGSVQEITLAATVLHTPDNKRVVIPNSAIWGSAITNYSFLPTRRIDMSLGVAYDSDLGKVKEIVTKIINDHKLTLDDPGPTVELVEMADSSLNLCVRPWVNTSDYWAVFFDLNQQIKEAMDAAGIEIPFPQSDLHLRDVPEDLFKALGNKSLSE